MTMKNTRDDQIMTDIKITRHHQLDRDTARQRLQKIADDLKEQFGIVASWDGYAAHLTGPGIKNGTVRIHESSVSMEITLGMLAKAFKRRIENRILSQSEEVLV
jgi:putative polyhydroxyalkanoate system protein